MKIDWEKLNHIFIPVPTAERRRRTKALPSSLSRLIDLAFSITGAGQACLIGGAVIGTLSIAAPHSRLPFVSGLALGLFFVSLALRGLFRVREGRAHLEQPSRVTVGELLEVRVVVTSREAPSALSVRGPFLPYFARYEGDAPTLRPEKGSSALAARAKVRFTRRSDLFLGSFAVARRVPFDLVAGPPIETEPFRIKIVPRPAGITRLDLPPSRDAALDASRGTRRGGLTDLAGVREYRPGDRIRDLDVRTWARTGVPAVREYQDPELSHALVLFDTEGDEGEAFEAAVSLVAGVAEIVARGALELEIVMIGETLHRLGSGRGRGVLPLVLDALAVAEPSRVFDAEKTLARISPTLATVSAVVFVTTRWDSARARVAETLHRRGVAVRAMVVAERALLDRAALPPYARGLTPAVVARGGLSL